MAQTLKDKINKNIPWLDGYKKNKDAQDIKNGVEGIISLMRQGDNLIKYDEDLSKYMNACDEFTTKFKDSDDSKVKNILQNFKVVNELYEKGNKKEMVNKDVKTTISDRSESYKQVKQPKEEVPNYKKAIKTSGHEIKNIEQKMDNAFQKLNSQIQTLGKSNMSSEIQTINNSLSTLKVDIVKKIETQFEKRKDTFDEIDMIPAKLDNLSDKFDSFNISSNSNKNLEIPKDEQAIVDLTKYMKDGLDQFQNIARYYIEKQSEFDKSDKVNQVTENALMVSEETGFKKGEKSERIRLAIKILEDFPDKFMEIRGVFDDVLTEEYEIDQEIEVTQDNRQEYEIKIEGIKTESTIIISSPAILIGGEVVQKATIKESK